jgi:hypothetical protein
MCDILYEIKNCENSADIKRIQLDNATTLYEVGDRYVFSKDGVDICAEILQIGTSTIVCVEPEVILFESFETGWLIGLADCNPRYECVSCNDPLDVVEIDWDCGEGLDTNKVHKFKSNTPGVKADTCYSVTKIAYTPAEDCSSFQMYDGIYSFSCNNQGVGNADIESQAILIAGGDPTVTVQFYSDPGRTQLIVDTTNHYVANGSNNTVIYVRGTNASGCVATATLTLTPCPQFDYNNLNFDNIRFATTTSPFNIQNFTQQFVAGLNLGVFSFSPTPGAADIEALLYLDPARTIPVPNPTNHPLSIGLNTFYAKIRLVDNINCSEDRILEVYSKAGLA